MKRQKLFISLFAFIISIQFSFAQKKQLDHSVYDDWKSLSNISVDNNGRFAATIIQPQEGDSKLFIQNLKTNRPFEYTRIASFALSPDGSYTVGFLKAPFADTRQAKIDKKKPEEMPKDSLLIVNNETFSYTILPNVKSYKTPQELGNYVAYKTTLETDTITTQPADTIITLSVDTTQTESKNNKKKEKDKEVLVLHNLKTHQQDTLLNAKEYIFNKYGNAFATIIEPDKKDSTDTPGVIFIDLNNYSKKRISNEKAEYKSLSFDESGEQLVYLSTQDTSKVEQKVFNLRYFNQKADSAVILATAKTAKLPTNWIFNENSNPNFSKNGKRILLGAAPKQAPKDTTIVDFEVASLDLWHWKDPYLQPQQLNYLSQELKRTYAGIIELDKNNEFTLLANEEMPYSTVSDEGNGRYTLLYSDIPYRLESQWDPPRYDAWIYDLETNKIRSIATSLSGRPSLSVQGNFVFWFDSDKGDWFVYDNRTSNTSNITEAIGVNFWNEKNDVPGKPGSYGIAAWGKDDAYVLINDMFDIWKIDPQNE
ncbi:MAG: S9 family peptidase, partial [Dysgonamonadaceae bacterium]|nr:S9 family peptidase [Dysgonamonadaceae bacterium]